MGGSQSLRALEEAWRRNPEATFVRLAGAYRAHGRLDDAARVVERGLGRRPGHLSGRVLQARIQIDQGDVAAAETGLLNLLDSYPDHWEAGWLLVRARRASGRRDAEREALTRLQSLHPGNREIDAALLRLDADVAFKAALPTRLPLENSGDAPSIPEPPPWGGGVGVTATSRPGRVSPPLRSSESDPFLNATMAELLLAQGDAEGAREVYRRLMALEPAKESHRARFVELGGEPGEAEDVPEDLVDPQVLEGLLEGLR